MLACDKVQGKGYLTTMGESSNSLSQINENCGKRENPIISGGKLTRRETVTSLRPADNLIFSDRLTDPSCYLRLDLGREG